MKWLINLNLVWPAKDGARNAAEKIRRRESEVDGRLNVCKFWLSNSNIHIKLPEHNSIFSCFVLDLSDTEVRQLKGCPYLTVCGTDLP